MSNIKNVKKTKGKYPIVEGLIPVVISVSITVIAVSHLNVHLHRVRLQMEPVAIMFVFLFCGGSSGLLVRVMPRSAPSICRELGVAVIGGGGGRFWQVKGRSALLVMTLCYQVGCTREGTAIPQKTSQQLHGSKPLFEMYGWLC
jgi:hypothetical protein